MELPSVNASFCARNREFKRRTYSVLVSAQAQSSGVCDSEKVSIIAYQSLQHRQSGGGCTHPSRSWFRPRGGIHTIGWRSTV